MALVLSKFNKQAFHFFKWLFLVSVIISSLSMVSRAQAAEFSFDAPTTVGTDQDFIVDFILDTKMENINAIEGSVVFDNNIFFLKEIRDADSVVSLWIKNPAAGNTSGVIDFSGITPGGYNSQDQKGKIFSLVFSATKEGAGMFTVSDSVALLSDGQGTKAEATFAPATIVVERGVSMPLLPALLDTEKPEPLFAQIVKNESLGTNKWVAIFYTHDKKSGISHYEIAEQQGDQVFDYAKLQWRPAQNPEVLLDQSRRSFVYIKAVDKVGNESISVLLPLSKQNLYQNIWFWCIIITLLLLCLGGFLWKRKIKK